MEEIKQSLEKIKKTLIEDINPLVIILFGSYSRNSQNSESDIDIAIISNNVDKKELFYEKQKLENEISKDIDLVNLNDKDMSDGFKYEVLMNGIEIYCSDSYKYNMIKLDMIRDYLELNEYRKNIIDRLKNGGTIYGK